MMIIAILIAQLPVGSSSAQNRGKVPADGKTAGTGSAPVIHLQYATFDPRKGEPTVADGLRADQNNSH